MLITCLLTAVVFGASLSVASRLYRESRSERALAAMVLTIGVVHGAVHLLGWLNVLTPGALAGLIVLLSAAMAGGAWAPAGREVIGARALAVVRLPYDALREAFQARSASFIALLWTYGILLWSLLLSYLAPSGSWDGLWYHEPMVGFALQNHGFAEVDLPTHLVWVNGYPRLSENLMLFCSAFGDRTLIDAVPHAMALTILSAFFVLARRFTRVRTDAMGLACVLLTIPGVVLQLRSTYVDLSVLALFLAALHFSSRDPFSRRDVWLAAISIGLLGCTKSTGLVYVGLIGGYGLVSVGRAARTQGRSVALHAVPAFVLAVALFAPTFVRNTVLHDNPIWPLRYHSESLGIDLPGPHDLQNMQLGFGAVMHELFGVPSPGADFADTRRHAFGFGITYLGIPLVLIALGSVFRALVERRRTANGGSPGTLLVLFCIAFFTFLSSPAFYWARYSLPFPAMALVVLAAFLSGRPRGVSGEGVFMAMFLINGVSLVWAEPRWDVPFLTAVELWEESPSERRYAETSPLLFSPNARRWRDEHIGAGDVAAFDGITAFIGNGWDESYSNRLIYVPFTGRAQYLDALDAAGVDWVMVQRDRSEDHALSNDARWAFQETVILDTMLYQRVSRFGGGAAAEAPGPTRVFELPGTRVEDESEREGGGEGEGEREGEGEGESGGEGAE